MTRTREVSIAAAESIEKDSRMLAINMKRRRSGLKRIRERNIKERAGEPKNELEHQRDVQLCIVMEKRIKLALVRMHKVLKNEFSPRDEYSEVGSQSWRDENERSAAH